jgi:hypothetical protein
LGKVPSTALTEKSLRFCAAPNGTDSGSGRCKPNVLRQGNQMRDIRGDLQDRANVIAEQIAAVQGQFDSRIEQLKREHQTKLEDLRSALRNVQMVIGIEERRLGTSMSANKRQPTPASQLQAPEAEPHNPLSGIRKVVGQR